MKYRVLVAAILVLSILLLSSAAYGLPYYVEVYDPTAVYLDQGIRVGEARGNSGLNYVMMNGVHKEEGVHVNSMFVWRNLFSGGYNYAEVGWHQHYGEPPTAFGVWQEGGLDSKRNYNEFPIGTLDRGSTHRFKIAATTGTMVWNWIIDGVEQHEETLGFGKGTPIGGSEKKIPLDTNYANWWDLQVKRTDGTYRFWADQAVHKDNDDTYDWRRITNSEFAIEK